MSVEDRKFYREQRKGVSQKARNEHVADLKAALKPDPETGEPSAERLRAALEHSQFAINLEIDPKTQESSVVQAILDGRVGTNYMPGLDFVGDKEFNMYVDGLVRLYTGEEPILTSVTAHPFGRGELDEKLFDEVFANKDKYVIKVFDGRGGDGIWVGPKISQKEFNQAKAKIRKEPWRYLVQEFTQLSELGDNIVDLRALGYMDSNGVFIGRTPWGRAISKNGDGKVNVSSNGFEAPVVVVRNPGGRCPHLRADLQEILPPRR